MELKKMFDEQAAYEAQIVSASGIHEDAVGGTSGSDLRYLALFVKLSELANLTKCYKYGDGGNRPSYDELKRHYKDVMQYTLSIGIHHGFTMVGEDHIERQLPQVDLAQLFLSLLAQVDKLRTLTGQDNFMDALAHYTRLVSLVYALDEALQIFAKQS